MKYDEIVSEVFGFSVPTYYNWKKEKRAIIDILDKYFSKEELDEFLMFKRILNKDIIQYYEYTNKLHLVEEKLYNEVKDNENYELYKLFFILLSNIHLDNADFEIERYIIGNNIQLWDLVEVLTRAKNLLDMKDKENDTNTLNLIQLTKNDLVDMVYKDYIEANKYFKNSIRLCLAYNVMKYNKNIDKEEAFDFVRDKSEKFIRTITVKRKKNKEKEFVFDFAEFKKFIEDIQNHMVL